MRKTILLTLLLAVLVTNGEASYRGYLGLSVDQSGFSNSFTVPVFAPTPIYIFYYESGDDHDGIIEAQFKIDVPATIIILDFIPNPLLDSVEGRVDSSLTCRFSECNGDGHSGLILGHILVLNTNSDYKELWIVEPDGLSDEPYEPRVRVCDGTIVGVSGGPFCTPESSCYNGTETATWGAIKAIYRE